MRLKKNITGKRGLMRLIGHIGHIGLMRPMRLGLFCLLLASCTPEPPLHLYDEATVELDQPIIDLDLKVVWDYELIFGVTYDWTTEWYYGWDEEDQDIFGELGYVAPNVFNLRRYYTGSTPLAPHATVRRHTVEGTHFQDSYEWGFWDLLVWNQIQTIDGVQSLHFDETTTLDSVTAYTNQSMNAARYNAPRYTHAFYAPEPLFSAYDQAIEINRNLDGFTYDPERRVYHRQLNMELHPITYIYLTQVILHHNNGRITSIDGSSNLSGMARSTCLNSGRAGDDAITVYYNSRFKQNLPYLPYSKTLGKTDGFPEAEKVDIAGGRLMTFGICGLPPRRVVTASDIHDLHRHYMDVTMQFNNGMDSTFVFDVTEQVRQRYKGGVLTVELDMDTVPIPQRKGGSGFNAVVKDFEDGGTHEFEM